MNLVSYINKPVVTTSVNINKSIPLKNIKLMDNFFPQIDIFKDDNYSKKSLQSTIIDFTKDPIKILRRDDGIVVK